jgi:molecular chaperone HtpG
MTDQPVPIQFKAETRQLLDILIHSLYSEREVFLRELISNAVDALTRLKYEMLTNRDVLDPEAQLAVWIKVDQEKRTLTISDTGIGMTAEEMVENLGTIAHSGARAFMEAVKADQSRVSDIIGQFGVGFYSAFMVAESISVTSRSYRPDASAAEWLCNGDDSYTIQPGVKASRGTDVVIHFKEDAAEFTGEILLKEIIQRHSDYVPFPIYLGEAQEQANRQTALWRQNPSIVKSEEYQNFYKELTLEPDPPIDHLHLVIDAPVQLYALIYVPGSPERGIFTTRKKEGLKLYASKVLLQEYCTDLLPEYLRFVEGVVDSEDLPLNVSRETVHATRIMAQLKKVITARFLDRLKTLGQEDVEAYKKFWKGFGLYLKQGIATDLDAAEPLTPLLRYHTLNSPENMVSLDDYVGSMKEGQQALYYILGDDERSILHSPHLEILKKHGFDVLLMTDPLDSFVLLRVNKYKEFELINVAADKLKLPDLPAAPLEDAAQPELNKTSAEESRELIDRFKQRLGDKVAEVRLTDRLVESPARLVDQEGGLNSEVQRVYRLLNKEYEVPQKVLEINPEHSILKGLAHSKTSSDLESEVIDQIYENALLIEGLHPDPARMIGRIQKLIDAVLHQ